MYTNSITLKNVNLVGKQNGVTISFQVLCKETKQVCISFSIITISTLLNHNRCLIDPSRRYIVCGIKAGEKYLRLENINTH